VVILNFKWHGGDLNIKTKDCCSTVGYALTHAL